GVETGYSDQGLAFSEETLNIKKPNPDGFSLVYLVRLIMEECSTLDQLPEYFNRYPVVGAYGTVWSDQKSGRGLVAELTPTAWEIIKMDGSLLWNFNHLDSDNLIAQQTAGVNLSPDPDRETLAITYPQKDLFEVRDAIEFLGLQVGPQGDDYSHCGTRNPICNKGATQMMVFHPDGDGVYLGMGVYYAARQNIYHYHDDFSKAPELFKGAVPMKPVVVETARIENLLLNNEGYRDAFIDLTKKYRDDANIHFLVALYSFRSKSLEQHAHFAQMAFTLNPEVAEYRLFAGIAAYFMGSFSEALGLLEQIAPADLYDRNEIIRLFVLSKSWQPVDKEKAEGYRAELNALLEQHDGKDYFESAYLPFLELGADE
ncbi:MAG: carcinine hydrolase/isopenicillin-N N-acyltransferase family protein, partial [Anaerolineaceae bacterium]|nr:carcinine hydrolase/isopenicillin-N N-acyltransferase family protein [Anaerolineaceae bacterium]